jgi:hypothetical protein
MTPHQEKLLKKLIKCTIELNQQLSYGDDITCIQGIIITIVEAMQPHKEVYLQYDPCLQKVFDTAGQYYIK